MTGRSHDSTQEALDLMTRAPGKRPSFLDENAIDHMFTMIMELSSQVWVLKERLYAYESVSDEANFISKTDIEDWTPTANQTRDLDAMRQAMLQDLFRSVIAKEPNQNLPNETADPAPPG